MSGRRERIARAILQELDRQSQVSGVDTPYVMGEESSLDDVVVDGHVDLVAIAEAIEDIT